MSWIAPTSQMSGADLTDAILTGADLSGADLSGADLDSAILTQIERDSDTKWPQGFDFQRLNKQKGFFRQDDKRGTKVLEELREEDLFR